LVSTNYLETIDKYFERLLRPYTGSVENCRAIGSAETLLLADDNSAIIRMSDSQLSSEQRAVKHMAIEVNDWITTKRLWHGHIKVVL